MSRYIDADFEIAHYTSMTTNPTPDVTEKDKRNSLIILDALRMAKTVDIVRCKECKYELICNHSVQHTTHDAHSVTIGYKSVGFCSYGERREP